MGNLKEFQVQYHEKELDEVSIESIILEKYEICSCIKASDYKFVYVICDKSKSKKYLMKSVKVTANEILEKEYHLHTSLSHEGLVSAVEYVKGINYNYFIREYIEGYTLTELVEMSSDGHLTITETLNFMLQLCEILKYLHTQRPPIIHRDIKPDNIIITKESKCKVIDFGISRCFDDGQEKDTVIMGTEYTAPPEQFGYKQTDARSDIYSLGIVMYFMMTGCLDIKEVNQYQINPIIKNIIRKCTEFSPEDRYANVNLLEKHLNKASLYTRGGGNLPYKVICAGMLGILLVYLGYQAIHSKDSMITSEPSEVSIEQIQNDTDIHILDTQKMMNEKENLEAKEHLDAIESLESKEHLQEIESLEAKEYLDEKKPLDENDILNKNEGSDSQNIIFESPLIEAAVRYELNFGDTEIITVDDLEGIEELYICGQQVYEQWEEHFVYGENQHFKTAKYNEDQRYNNNGEISSLEDVRRMKNLHTLALYNQKISDVSPLVDLDNLKRLGLGLNNISDIVMLKELSQLEILDLSANPIEHVDLSVLQKLKELHTLDLSATKVTDANYLKGLNLISLSLWGNFMADCNGFEHLESLKKLIVTGVGNGITKVGLKRILGLTNLIELRTMGGIIDDVTQYNQLSNLKELDLGGNQLIASTTGLNLTSLIYLGLDWTGVEDISSISNLQELSHLGIMNIPCTDYEVLAQLPNLKTVGCNEEQEALIREQIGDTSINFYH